jgi:tetratricopeptide (TPR) repeat protein/class 3 adenylate cyclase
MAGTRQLAAIVCSEIDGYATLIQKDEPRAAELKKRYREVLNRLAETYHGKIHQNSASDSLSLFSSAVEAVQCAIEMQRAFREEPAVPVKFGIHLGDIMFTEEEAYGDSIQVARQMRSQALPGGILVSGKIFKEVRNQSGIATSYLKACELEEQGSHVEIYAITNEGLTVPDLPRSDADAEPGGATKMSGLRRFWEEAKRRNVVRFVAWYAGVAYVIIELIGNLADPLNMPPWLPTIVDLLVIIGFPVTAIFFWIFDITPEGLKKTKPASEVEFEPKEAQPASDANWFARNKVFRRYLIPLLVVALLAAFYVYKDRLFGNLHRVSKAAREHTEVAILYYKNQADPAMIKQELDLALKADPDYAVALYYYALVHRLEMDTLDAKQKLHAAVNSDPGYSLAWDLLANFAFRQDSFELAMEYGIQAIETDPGNANAAYNLAIQCQDRGLNSQAIEFFRKAIQQDSTFVSAYSALGALYNSMGRPAEAILTLHKSLEVSPASVHNYRVYKNLAEAHYLLKEYDKAQENLEQSKALNGDYPETEKCFARNYEAKGDLEASSLHWRRYLALENDSLELQKAQQHLDSIRLQLIK